MNTLNTVYSRIYKGLQVQQQIDSDSLILAGYHFGHEKSDWPCICWNFQIFAKSLLAAKNVTPCKSDLDVVTSYGLLIC
jgi:hypothetical protein